MENNPDRKSSVQYWTKIWNNRKMPSFDDLSRKHLKNYSLRKLDNFFERNQSTLMGSRLKNIEIGCGNSIYLTYFNRKFHHEVFGIDYSSIGCEQTRLILERDKINGQIILGDLFNPPKEFIGQFDIACSFGVIEHFDDTENVLKKISEFVKPGGIIITLIPNMIGLTGFLQKLMNKPVYDIHKPMSMNELIRFNSASGLEILDKELLVPIAFGVTLDANEGKIVHLRFIKSMLLKCLQIFEKVIWLIDDFVFKVPTNELFCAGMIVLAKKTESEQ